LNSLSINVNFISCADGKPLKLFYDAPLGAVVAVEKR
jgi:hypothetical protein